ncbi:MFS transporter [Phyllobacterium sp. CCNWLW11]|uniref:MFS transporter n=1 Tax=Phyllobacterium sp. CCNWLW11 TaxID=3126384 RepID=UPI003012DBD2
MGGTLIFYDFLSFAFLIPIIGRLFLPADTAPYLAIVQTFGIFAAGYIFRPLGGIVLGRFGDIIGRKRIFAFSILLMTFSTLAISALPTYHTIGVAAPLLLVAFRLLQGIALCGEVPGAWTYVAEHCPRQCFGLICGITTSGFTVAIFIASLVTAGIYLVFSIAEIEAFAWRIPLWIGGILGLPAVYMRWRLTETSTFINPVQEQLLIAKLPLATVLRNYPSNVVVSFLLTWVVSAVIIVAILMPATLLQTAYGYSAEHALISTCVGSLFLALSTIVAGAVIDRLGVAFCLMVGSVLFAFATIMFYSSIGSSIGTLYLGFVLMGTAAGMLAAAPYVMVTAFPARVRVTGISFSYNVSYAVFGASTPVALAWLIHFNKLAPAYYLMFIALLAFGIGVYIQKRPGTLENAGELDG